LRQAYEFDLMGTVPARSLPLAAEAVQWTSWGRLRGAREALCALDARGCLRDMDGRLLVDLSSLQLKGAALYAGADVLVITGVSQCPRAIARQEPYVAVFLRAEAGAGLRRLGERFFPMVRGPIRALCRDAFSGRYFLFFDLPAGISLTPWTTAQAGTAEELLGGREMERELPCPAGPLSAAVSGNVLLVCGGGVIVACRAGDLTYLSAYAGAATRVLPAEAGALIFEEAALAALTPINGEGAIWNRIM
jgi:hypothetical protein